MKKITPVMMNKHSVMRYSPLDIRTERNAPIAASDDEGRTAKIRSAKSHRQRQEPPILSPSPRGVILKKGAAQTKRRCYGAQSVTERKLRRRSRKSQAAAAADTPDASHFDFKTVDDNKLVNNRKKREKSPPRDIESSIDSRQTKGERGHGVDELKSDVDFDDSESDDDSFPIIKRWISSSREKNRLFILEDDESEDDLVNGDFRANKITAKKGSNDADQRLKSINKHFARETAGDSNREKVAPKIASQISDSEDNIEFSGRHSPAGTRRTRGKDRKVIRKVSTAKKSFLVLSSKTKKPSSLQKKTAIMVGKAAAARSPYVAEAYTRAAASFVTESRNEIIGKTTKSARPQNKCFEFPEEVMKYVDGIDEEGSTGDASNEFREDMSDGSSAYFPSYSGDDVAVDERVSPHPRKSLARKKNVGDVDCASRHDPRPIVEERGKNLQCQQKPKFEDSQQVIDPNTDNSHNHVFGDDFRISSNRHVAKQPCVVLKTMAGKNAFLHWNCDESGEKSTAFDDEIGGRGDQYFERNSDNGSLDDYDQNSHHAEDKVAGKYLSNIYTQLEDPVVGSYSASDASENEICISKQCEIDGFEYDSRAENHASEKDGGHSKGNERTSNNLLDLETRSSSGNSGSQNSQAKTVNIAPSKEDAPIVANEVKLHRFINGQTMLVNRKKYLVGIDCFGNENEPVTNLEGICSKKNDIMDMNDDDHNSSKPRVKRSTGVKNEKFIDSGDEYEFVEFNTRNISKVDPETLIAALQTQPIEFVQSTQLSRAIESSNTYDECPCHNFPSNAQLTSQVPEAEITNAHISVSDKFRELENLLSRSIEIMHEIKSSISVE